MSNIAQYLSDHTNAGACAANYYGNTHDINECRVPAGICSVIAYLVIELKNAEQRAPLVQPYPQPQYTPAIPPLSPVPPVTTLGGNGSQYTPTPDGTGLVGGGGSGSLAWSDPVETRRS